jgi:eukaryotic-like serine/threonine-protein kinase
MSREEFEARVGTWLRDKWKLERLLAVGGMAGVYVARHKIGKVAAIKLLRTEIAVDKRIRERFEQEAHAIHTVGHDGVVEVLDVDEVDDGTPFMVMELLDGETLADRVERDRKIKVDHLLDIVDQLLDVLVACHKKGIIHRDIKPENLFIQQNGRLKVLDFGIARMREGVKTVAGTMLGTVAFMPPEQLKGADIDARADLYSVGATMFAVLAGRRIHEADNDTDLAIAILGTPAPSLSSVVPSVPMPVCMIVDRALAFLPDRRYPDAQTMRGDVWAAKRNQRPPYANACKEAGQAPDVMKEPKPDDGKKTRPDAGALPSTDPQLPIFDKPPLPTTAEQLPVFVPKERPPEAEPPDPTPPPDTNEKWPPVPAAKATKENEEPEAEVVEDEAAPDSGAVASVPPQGEPEVPDARQVTERASRRRNLWLVAALLVSAGVVAAWYAGALDVVAPSKPKTAPSAKPK